MVLADGSQKTWYDERCHGRHHFCTSKLRCDARGGKCRYIPLTDAEAARVRKFWWRAGAAGVALLAVIVIFWSVFA